MEQATLVLVDQVSIERCPNCKGLFLDRAELKTINIILRQDGRTKHDEQIRKYIDGRLVTVRTRIEPIPSSGHYGGSKFAERIVIKVFYKKELNNDFSVVKSTQLNRFLKVIGLRRGLTLAQVSKHIERQYLVSAKNELLASSSMNFSVQQKIEQIDKGDLKILSQRGEISLFDNGLVYTEGLYSKGEIGLLVAKTRKMLTELVELARAVDRQH